MKLRWTKGRRGGTKGSWTWEHLMFWDLIDDERDPAQYPEGVTLGWIRGERRKGAPTTYMAYRNDIRFDMLIKTHSLEEAKAALVACVVADALEDME